jgi:hypothetical protein
MNKNAFDSLFNNDKILITPQGRIQEQILSSENCFNPLIVIARAKNPTIEIFPEKENKEYFESLTQIRQAIETKSLIDIIYTLGEFYNRSFALSDQQTFADFIMFNGLFHGCQWFKNTATPDFPQDLICRKDKIPAEMKLEAFLEERESPRYRLEVLFDGRQDIETDKIGSIGHNKNPIGRIFQGKLNREGTAFEEAIECLRSIGFNEAWKSLKKTHEENSETNTKPDNVGNDGMSKIITSFPMTDKKIVIKLKERFRGKKLTEPLMRELEEIVQNGRWTDEEKAEIFGVSREWYTKKRTERLGKKRGI